MFVQPLVHLERDTQSGKVEDWNLAMHITPPRFRKYGENMKESTLQQMLINSLPRILEEFLSTPRTKRMCHSENEFVELL